MRARGRPEACLRRRIRMASLGTGLPPLPIYLHTRA
ncbi:hypothetical protein QE331_gp149 [Pseudomonas phage 20Sep416]|uniref:Uncharacterized protein n=2 Tax=Pakpunavirus TaxID=1921407 RepID=A0AAF0JIF2_9CAUD|nr:hypothetical protein QE331_gp149 [Pseudomonas phage 20Sep416]WFG37157.1 hypothetical protein 9081_00042 [Pseudomonas phage bmx-p3]WFG37658.1 hypothetical protein 20Sep416_00178 [Pseudomonas phage 20Sep416]